MALTGIRTLPVLRGVTTAAGPWQALLAKEGQRVYPYQLGAMVRADSTGTTISTHGLGDIAVGDFVMVCDPTSYGSGELFVPDTTKIVEVTVVNASDDEITVGTAVTVSEGDYLFNLGVDAASPAYDASDITLYTDNAGNNANANKYLTTAQGGWYRGWVNGNREVCDLLITDSSAVPKAVQIMKTLGRNLSIPSFADSDATPSVKSGNVFKTSSAGASITDLDDGVPGQRVLIIFINGLTDLADSGNLKLAGAITGTADDTIELIYDGSSWFEISRSVN